MSRWLRVLVHIATLCGSLEARNRQGRAKSNTVTGPSFGHRCCDVERVDTRELSRERFSQLESEQRPFILEHALDHWPAMKWTIPTLQERFGDTKLRFSVQGLFKQIPAEDTLGTFLSMMPQSSHDKALYSLTENLAYANGETMEDVGEVWWKHFDLFDEDWFQWFPPDLRPTDRAFIFAGKGGFSGLHVDSYNWTGWNALFLGENYWRFLPPTVDPAWMHYRRIGKQGNISANYMSPANSFHFRPDPAAAAGTVEASFRPDADHIPFIDRAMEQDLQFVQRAGDVVWIPPGWWHQVYHATTTVGFASQYMNEHSANSVLEHIREWSTHDPINGGQGEGVSAACLGAEWEKLRPKPKVQRCKLQPLTCNPRWVAHLEDADSDEAANESGQAGTGATESTRRQGKGRARRRKEKSRRTDEGEF